MNSLKLKKSMLIALSLISINSYAQNTPANNQTSTPANNPFYEPNCKRHVLFNESMDWSLPAATKKSNGMYDWKPTPTTIEGVRTVNACDVETLISKSNPLLIFTQPLFMHSVDGPNLKLAPNTIWVPNAGLPNANNKILTFYGQKILATVKGDLNKQIIVYSRGTMNWESINLIISLKQLGFTNLLWFRGGQDSWLNANPARKTIEISPRNTYLEFMSPQAFGVPQ